MTAAERKLSGSLALVFALRMLGLFLILPVFALEAQRYPGGDDPALVGLVMGSYGMTQALLQLPFGWASDHWGRKPIILFGLLFFIAGSVICAATDSLHGLLLGRSLQGAGAISAAITALLADGTRDIVRTKAMALIGISIGLMFAVSLVLAPLLVGSLGFQGMFWLIAALGVGAFLLISFVVPAQKQQRVQAAGDASWGVLWRQFTAPQTWRLNLGVFILHAVQLAMWSAVPILLVREGLPQAEHWHVYLPAVLASMLIMGGLLFRLERKGYLRAVFLSQIALLVLVQLALYYTSTRPSSLWEAGLILFAFFCAFNMLEATQPSLVSRYAANDERGTALGVYNTMQSVGLFVGGAAGGWLIKDFGMQGLFAVCALALVLWLALAWSMQAIAGTGTSTDTSTDGAAIADDSTTAKAKASH
jgi:MFS family permease